MQKILLNIREPDILEDYVSDVLGRLITFDKEHGTDYLSILKYYLDYNGSVQKVADKTYVHRNTVNYQLNKIKKILEMDLGTFEERFRLIFAFKILDIL